MTTCRVHSCLQPVVTETDISAVGFRRGELGMNFTCFARLVAFALAAALSTSSTAGPSEDADAAYRKGDYATAFGLARELAPQGDALAQSLLGLLYRDGHGVPQDYQQAVEWLRKAAEQGRVHAQYNLGNMYETGRGVAKDHAEAIKWWRKAAEQGLASAQDNLGVMYRDGRGVAQDDTQAVDWFRKAAEQGNAMGQGNLGYMYETGRGVEKDEAEAIKWYRKEAEQANVRAKVSPPGATVADTYVILSLVGDHITIVGQGSETGSHLDKNQYQVAQLTDQALDNFAVRTIDATLASVRPDAAVITLRSTDPTLYALRDSWLDADSMDVQALLALVTKQLPLSPDAHLVLVTSYRGQPEMKAGHTYRGIGKVAGLGLYLGPWNRTRPRTLGAFANFQLVVINLKTGAIDSHERFTIGTLFTAVRSDDGEHWIALTRQQTGVLEVLLRREIQHSLPHMLSSASP
jgi:TPR repeat protein